MSPETLERYTRVYAAKQQPSFKMTVTRRDDEFYTQATGSARFQIHPSSKTRFYPKVVDAQIECDVQDDGSVPRLTLNQQGQEIVFKRTDEEGQ